MKTLQEQYNLIKEGKGNKQQFFKSARHLFPDLVTPVNTFEDTVRILKNRGIITEGIGGVVTAGKKQDWHAIFNENMEKLKEEKRKLSLKQIDKKDKKGLALYKNTEDSNDLYYYDGKVLYSVVDGDRKGPSVRMSLFDITGLNQEESLNKDNDDDNDEKYKEKIDQYEKREKDIEKFGLHHLKHLKEAKEAKAEEKETTKEVTDMATRGYDYKDEKNYDNVFGQEFLQGYYVEMKDPKNEGKHVEELRQIVAKNLAKDINYYVKNGQFGVKGLGYITDAPGLGEPKPAKGKHKSSGYGDLKESVLRSQIYLLVKEVLTELQPEPSAEKEQFGDMVAAKLKGNTEALKYFNQNETNITDTFLDHSKPEGGVDDAVAHILKQTKAAPLSENNFSEYSNDALNDMIINLSRFEGNKEEIQMAKAELARRKNVNEAKKKPSAGLTKKEKSAISKKAHAGKDIGEKGKGFEKVAKAAEKQYGSKEAGERVAAAAMWKSQAAKKG